MKAAVPWVERLLWTVAFVCLLYCGFYSLQARSYQVRAMQMGTPVATAGASTKAPQGETRVMGRLEIADISLSVPILAGEETESLQHGLFHIKGTAMPGGLGTVGLAGHRDTFFRPLRKITPRMGIELIDGTGVYHYAIDSTEIVMPDRVEVLDIHQRPELTLVTCYPFNFIGAAPKRFIVHAHLVSVAPDASRASAGQ